MKPWLASAGAVAGGFLVTAIASTIGDAILEGIGVFPRSAAAMTSTMFTVASAYRALFTVAGGYTTVKLAPDRPMRHAWILAGIGLVAGVAGLVFYYTAGQAKLGPAWYAFSIPLEAIPCVWLGAKLATDERKPSHRSR